VAREYANVELVGHLESPLGLEKGLGFPGWITKDAFYHFLTKIVEDLKGQGHFDGAYLSLHDARWVCGSREAERKSHNVLREVIGPKAFMVAKLRSPMK